MKLNAILAHVRKMKDRDGLKQIMNAAEARDAKLSNIESGRERKRLWERVSKLGVAKGDTVYIHTKADGKGDYISGQHKRLYGHPLTVTQVKTRDKVIVVRVPGETIDHRLSPGVCIKLKLSKKPSSSALSNALQGKMSQAQASNKRSGKIGQPIHTVVWPSGNSIRLGRGAR